MSLKLFAAINTLGVLGWLPILPISLFFWEDAGNPLMLRTLAAIYGGAILSFSAFLISFKNLESRTNDLSSSKGILVWLGTLASFGGIGFLVYLKNWVL